MCVSGRDGPRSGGRGRPRGPSQSSSLPPEHLKRRKLISYADLDAPDPETSVVSSNTKIDYGLDDDDDDDEGEIRDNDDVDSS